LISYYQFFYHFTDFVFNPIISHFLGTKNYDIYVPLSPSATQSKQYSSTGLTSTHSNSSKPTKPLPQSTNQTTYDNTSAVMAFKAEPQTYASLLQAHSNTINELLADFEIPYSELVIGKKLGEGNFGEVSLVYYKDMPLACKTLKENVSTEAISASQAVKKRTQAFVDFVAEAKLLAKIPPSGIISFLILCFH